jgi:hypothetical protein
MPQRTHRLGKSLSRLLFLAAALSLLSAVVRRDRRELLNATRARKQKVRVAPRKIAVSLVFATLFFAGAAFSAGAGNTVAELMDPSSESAASSDTTTTETTTEETTEAPAEEPAATESAPEEPQPQEAADAAAEEPTAEESAAADARRGVVAQPVAAPEASPTARLQSRLQQRARSSLVASGGAQAKQAEKQHGKPSNKFFRQPPVLAPQPMPLRNQFDREPEADEPNVAATIWLHRVLPDPTPPSRRLTRAFAKRLLRVSAKNHVDWALTLAVLRASGERGAAPATRARLMYLTKQLASLKAQKNPWGATLALEGRTTFADRTVALQHLYRAVGLKALIKGYEWAKPSLSKRILNDKRISIYPGGRSDIQTGRVNIRVLVLIAYLAEAHGQVTVSCLISGHRLYARPGVISAHIFGLAADISTLGGTSIMGHQQVDSVTEKAVRNILLLPAEMQPRQVISLLGMGGPSFPLANHDDHIHVGF